MTDQLDTADIEAAIGDQILFDKEQFQQWLYESGGLDAPKLVSVKTFAQAGLLTRDKGQVLKFADGSEFEVTITQRKRAR